MAIRALIADDEQLARQGVRDLLRGEPDVEVVGESGDGRAAVRDIEALRPDLLFLDVQMPELDGFDVVRTVGVDRVPVVIFITAFDAHALAAFDVHAIDYLLKPVDRERFRIALRRARGQLDHRAGEESRHQLAALLAHVTRGSRDTERLLLRVDGRAFFVPLREIDWIGAEGNYARVRAGTKSWLVRETLGALEEQLDPARFARVHRSSIVNLDRVREFQPMFKGDHVVIMADGTRLRLSRKYRELLETRLGKSI